MVRSNEQKMFDLAILAGLIVAIYYLRVQATGDIIGPTEGVMSFLGLN